MGAWGMHRLWTVGAVASGALLALGGCATVDPTADFGRVQEAVQAATGAGGLYRPGEDERAAKRVEELLDGGLTAQEAVQVSLLNNRELQVLLFEVGVGRAEAVQAGLLSNPSLGVMLRLPLGDGSTTTEGALLQNVIELWHIPARRRRAENQLEQALFAVAHEAATLAAKTKTSYVRATAAEAALAVAEENYDTARMFFELTEERLEAGAATQVGVNAAQSEFLEQELLVREARYDVFEARRRLAVVLGLETNPADIELTEALGRLPDRQLRLDGILAIAAESRLDLRAATESVEAAENELSLERRLFLRSVRGGLSFESRDGDTELGPAVQLQVPVFDQNQAQIAKAEYRYAQALRRFEGLNARAAQEVRGAYERYALAMDSARLYEERLLPVRRASLELARESFAEGKTGFLSVLEAQSRLLVARREYVARLEAVARSVPDLEAACGRPLAELMEAEGQDAKR